MVHERCLNFHQHYFYYGFGFGKQSLMFISAWIVFVMILITDNVFFFPTKK